jgi:mono/diheme cytochrome c family protein
MCPHRPALLLLVVFIPAFLLIAAQAEAQVAGVPIKGAEIYENYCAACHGNDGRGHGPASTAMRHTVPDLTRLQRQNKGVFPAEYVRKVVAGDIAGITAQGKREMPVFGPVFHAVAWDRDLGEVKLDMIVSYVASIQQK